MTANKILEIELELKKNGLTNLGITVFKKRFLQKYEVALLVGPNEPFFWDTFKKSREFNSSKSNYFVMQLPAQPEQKKLLKY